MGVPKTSDHIQINIRMPNPSQEPPASSKAPNQDLKDMDILCIFKIKIYSQNLEHRCIKDQWPNKKSRSRCQSPVRNLQCPPKPKQRTVPAPHINIMSKLYDHVRAILVTWWSHAWSPYVSRLLGAILHTASSVKCCIHHIVCLIINTVPG